jgi:sugar (pentulose or hexulose) kinase
MGIIGNMKDMIPADFLENRERIIASGNAMRRNELLVKAAERIFKKDISILEGREEAACGAARLAEFSAQLYGFSEK